MSTGTLCNFTRIQYPFEQKASPAVWQADVDPTEVGPGHNGDDDFSVEESGPVEWSL
jgi:hypothetical protein